MDKNARIGVVGATGAVGTVVLDVLRERGFANVRAFASERSAGKQLGDITVEVATAEALAEGDLDVCFFSVGTAASRELVPHAVRGGAIAVDKSAAYRLQDGVPLVVPEVNGARAAEHDGIVANPNCCSIPLTLALKPLHDAAGLARVLCQLLDDDLRRRRTGERARSVLEQNRGATARTVKLLAPLLERRSEVGGQRSVKDKLLFTDL